MPTAPQSNLSRNALRTAAQVVVWTTAGILTTGALLDAFVTSVAFFTPVLSASLTVFILALWCTGEILVKHIRPRLSVAVAVHSIGPRPRWAVLGALCLIWVGAFGNFLRAESPAAMATACGTPVQPSVIFRSTSQPARGITTSTSQFFAPCDFPALMRINEAVDAMQNRIVAEYLKDISKAEEDHRKFQFFDALPAFGPNGRYLDLTCRPRLVTPVVISVLCNYSTYIGMHAHDAQFVSTLNFELDLTTARQFGLRDLIIDGSFAHDELIRIVRSELRRQHVDESWRNLESLLDESLGEGFGLTADGAAFRLGHYVTGPYTDGVKEVVVPFSQLAGVFRSDGPYALIAH